MTGSHEVRGSIPLGSTNTCNKLVHPFGIPFFILLLIVAQAIKSPESVWTIKIAR